MYKMSVWNLGRVTSVLKIFDVFNASDLKGSSSHNADVVAYYQKRGSVLSNEETDVSAEFETESRDTESNVQRKIYPKVRLVLDSNRKKKSTEIKERNYFSKEVATGNVTETTMTSCSCVHKRSLENVKVTRGNRHDIEVDVLKCSRNAASSCHTSMHRIQILQSRRHEVKSGLRSVHNVNSTCVTACNDCNKVLVESDDLTQDLCTKRNITYQAKTANDSCLESSLDLSAKEQDVGAREVPFDSDKSLEGSESDYEDADFFEAVVELEELCTLGYLRTYSPNESSNGYIGGDSDLEEFEQFYDARMEFVDSFERSVVVSTEVQLNGESEDEKAISIDLYNAPSRKPLDIELELETKKRLDVSLDEKKKESKVDGKVPKSVTICEPGKFRKRLPQSMHSRNEFNIWSVLKHAIGKDLSRIAMPVIFNEPLSFLQRIVEYMDYAEYLQRAGRSEDPEQRLLNVTLFAISSQAPNHNRIGKPFNPLLGETYELIRDDLDLKLVGEQVSHHPPISALWCQSSLYKIQVALEPIIKFWGKDIEVKTKGSVTIEFPQFNDAYTFTTIHTGVHNIIVGNMWIELYGVMEIISHKTGHRSVVNFKPCGWFGKDLNRVDGYIMDPSKTKVILLDGDWTSHVFTCPADKPEIFEKEPAQVEGNEIKIPEGAELAWTAKPKPPNAKEMYNMTEFAMSLNELLDEQQDLIAPTDSRFRPDIRELENANIELAASEKFRLEEKQRAARKERNKTNEEWRTKWFDFKTNKYTGQLDWAYNGEYFKRDWSRCPDIF